MVVAKTKVSAVAVSVNQEASHIAEDNKGKLQEAHNLVRKALVIVTEVRGTDSRSEVIAATNGLVKADKWLGATTEGFVG